MEKAYERTQGQSPLHWFEYYHQRTSLVHLRSDSKSCAYNAGDRGSVPESGKSPGEGNGTPLQYFCLENPMDREAWWTTVHGVAKSHTRLSDFTFFLLSPTGRCSKLGVLLLMTDQSLLPSFSKLVDLHFKILLKQNQLVKNFHIIWGSCSDYLDVLTAHSSF